MGVLFIGAVVLYANPTSIEDSLVAFYTFNDDTNSTVVIDTQGYSNGTFTDATGDPNTDAHATTGKINGALDFDGTDDYVDTGNTFESTFQDSFSISLWIKPDDGWASGSP
ncbi:unnamed protein product, partial [marine sediment metagenome]